MQQSEQETRVDPSVRFPADKSELSARLRQAIAGESQSAFARRAGVAESVLRKYLHGAQPSSNRLIAIADAANVSIEWLAAGRGPKERQAAAAAVQPAVHFGDLDLLRQTIEAVETGLVRGKITLPPDKYAELVGIAYEMMLEGSTANSVARVIQFKAA